MSRIFLSHSNRDNRAALALRAWLTDQHPELANEVFLDIDPDNGLRRRLVDWIPARRDSPEHRSGADDEEADDREPG